MLTITFEQSDEDTFVHMTSTSGVIGHAREIREKIPKGTWLTIPSKLKRLTPWLVKNCEFKFVATVFHKHDLVDCLVKE